MRALARIPTARSAELVLSALNHKMDEFLDYAVWLSINDLGAIWADAIASGAWKSEGREKQLEFGLKALEPKLASGILSKLLAGKTLDATGPMIELIGQAGAPEQLQMLWDQATIGKFDTTALSRSFRALAEAARLRNAKPSSDQDRVLPFLKHADEGVRAAAVRLAGAWKQSAAVPELLALAGDADASAAVRNASFEALREIGNKPQVSEGLHNLAAKNDKIRRQAAATLAAVDLGASVPLVVDALKQTADEQEALEFWRSLLSVKGAGAAIARAAAKTSLPESVAKAGLRAAREGARSEPDLVLALARSANLSDDSQNLTPAEIQQIVAKVKDGNPAHGELVYRRKELGCVLCHSIGGAGGKVGPDLTSIGASSPVDYLVESVFVPNRKVKEGYNSIQVTTKDEQELSGVLVRETDQELILRDATNKEISIPKKNISSKNIGGSLMPAGLADVLSPSERLDMVRFLSELGKPGPFDASKQTVARVWRVNAANATANDGDVAGSDLTGNSWQPIYTTVNGALLKQDLENELSLQNRRESFFAAARFQTARSGSVKLTLHGLNTPKAWIDGKPAGGNTEISADLPAGTHTLVVKLDPAQLPPQIMLETSEGSFLVD